MKLCFVGNASSYHVSKWVSFYGQRGHDVHVISTSPATIEGVTVHYLRNPSRLPILRHVFYWTYWREARRIIRDLQPDLVHGLQINIYSALASTVCSCPFIITPFGGDVLINPNKSLLAQQYARMTLRRADMVVCDGVHHIRPTLQKFGGENAKLHVVYFGVDVDRYRPLQRDEKLWAELNLGDSPVVISLRHLMPVYNIDTLLHAIKLVLDRVPQAKFVIVGTGPEEARLKQLACDLKIQDGTRFVGWVDGAELPRYFSIADIYVSTSLSDTGLASSTAEAMACGVVPVITDFGDNSLWVKEGVNGYLFPLRDAPALAERLTRLLLAPDERKSMATRTRQVIVDGYNWRTEMEKMERIYSSLIAEQNGQEPSMDAAYSKAGPAA